VHALMMSNLTCDHVRHTIRYVVAKAARRVNTFGAVTKGSTRTTHSMVTTRDLGTFIVNLSRSYMMGALDSVRSRCCASAATPADDAADVELHGEHAVGTHGIDDSPTVN
jgi:hypothetical protein